MPAFVALLFSEQRKELCSIKKIISILLSCTLLLGTVSVANADSAEIKIGLSKGDKLIIGTYKGEPVEYTVWGEKDVTGDGVNEFFIASSQIVTYKELHNYNGYNDKDIISYKQDKERRTPALRTWLNSRDDTVNYGTGITPSYASQPGFLSSLTDYEYNAIVNATVQSAYVADGNETFLDGNGGANYVLDTDKTWPEAYNGGSAGGNYSQKYYVNTSDRVFIPSIGELYEFGGATAEGGKLFMNVGATAVAIAEAAASGSPYVESLYTQNRTLLRDAVALDSGTGRRLAAWYSEKSISRAMKLNTVLGIRPCMYLKADTTFKRNSDGTYSIAESDNWLTIADDENGYKAPKACISNKTSKSVDASLISVIYKDGVIKDIASKPVTIPAGESKEVVGSPVYQRDGLMHRFFLWENASLKPLDGTLEYTITEEDISYCYICYKWGILKNEPTDSYLATVVTGAGAASFIAQIGAGQIASSSEPVTASEFYKALLEALGYAEGTDYQLLGAFLRGKGIGNYLSCSPFTVADMCNALSEALSISCKGEAVTFAQKLYNEGKMPYNILTLFQAKFAKQSGWSLTKYSPSWAANKSGDFTFGTQSGAKKITDFNFAYNVPYHYSGSYYGTLPADNPKNQRTEFDEALKKAGAKALRFPGGEAVHYYFMEGERFGKQLMNDYRSFMGTVPGGFYDPNDPDDSYYTDFYNFMDFCTEYGYDVLLQVNPSLFVDENGTDDTSDDRVRMAYPEVAVKTDVAGNVTGNFTAALTGYYDHNRIDEAAEQLRRNIRKMKTKGYTVKMWEIGNEDHFKLTGQADSYENNQFVKDYFDAAVAYAKVIKEEIPDAYVIADGFDMQKALDAGVVRSDDLAYINSAAVHYPFARYSGSEEEKTNPAYLAGINDVHFTDNWVANSQSNTAALMDLAITETTVYKFEQNGDGYWDSNRLQQSFGNALSTAHNWGQMVFDTGYTISVMHDLESPWFGSVLHNVTYNPGTNTFAREYSGYNNLFDQDIPDNYKFYGEYFVSSAGRVFELLSRHVSETVLAPESSNQDMLVSAYASVSGKKLRITVVNRLGEEKTVNIKLKNHSVSNQTVTADVIHSDDTRAVIEADYTCEKVQINVSGNGGVSSAKAVTFTAKPYSVTQFVVDVD